MAVATLRLLRSDLTGQVLDVRRHDPAGSDAGIMAHAIIDDDGHAEREDSMTTGMIVLAGGIGKRIGRPFPKQFLLLGGKPLIIHVLEKARDIPEIERVVITCPEGHLEATSELIANHRLGDEVRVHPRRRVAPGVGLQRAARPRRRSTR